MSKFYPAVVLSWNLMAREGGLAYRSASLDQDAGGVTTPNILHSIPSKVTAAFCVSGFYQTTYMWYASSRATPSAGTVAVGIAAASEVLL